MQMLKDRNRTAPTYNEQTATEIAENTLFYYYKLFTELKLVFEQLLNS